MLSGRCTRGCLGFSFINSLSRCSLFGRLWCFRADIRIHPSFGVPSLMLENAYLGSSVTGEQACDFGSVITGTIWSDFWRALRGSGSREVREGIVAALLTPVPRVTGTEHGYMLSSDRILGWSRVPLQAAYMQLCHSVPWLSCRNSSYLILLNIFPFHLTEWFVLFVP